MIQLIASAAIQRLKMKATSPKKKLSTVSEEEGKEDEGDRAKVGVPPSLSHSAPVLV